jgi:uncharacterized membrane protein YcaP (DUF421 family)
MNEYLLICISTAAIYLFIVIGFRIFGKKELAQISLFDLVFILLLGNAVQNAMIADNNTLWGGLTSAATLFVINYIVKILIYYFPKLGYTLKGKELLLIYKGQPNIENLRKSHISLDELKEIIREHGVAEFREVDIAMLEADGHVSVLSNNFNKKSQHKVLKRKRSKRIIEK